MVAGRPQNRSKAEIDWPKDSPKGERSESTLRRGRHATMRRAGAFVTTPRHAASFAAWRGTCPRFAGALHHITRGEVEGWSEAQGTALAEHRAAGGGWGRLCGALPGGRDSTGVERVNTPLAESGRTRRLCASHLLCDVIALQVP